MTYYNGKVLPLICFEGAGARGRQLINKKTLILANSGSDFSSQIYLSVVKGKLKILQQTYRQNMKKGYPPQYLYKVNNKKVSESIYQKAIDKYGLSENVEIVENMSFKIDIIKKSNCIISTRKREEFALDNIIAIILNKPILVSNVGINKLIFKQENIFYNSDELKEKMKSNIEENKDFEKYYDIELNEREEILKSESI